MTQLATGGLAEPQQIFDAVAPGSGSGLVRGRLDLREAESFVA
jgi:hypothetical protein